MAERRAAAAVFFFALALAGCKPAGHNAAVNTIASAPSPAATPLPQAAPTPTATPPALGGYAGHYPFDKVGGVAFLDDPAVVAAVDSLVPDAAVRKLVLGGDGPGTPIATHGGKLIAWGCETHNCGDHDWTIEIAPDGSAPAVCYHDAATMHDRSRWYTAPGRAELRAEPCPSN